MAGLDRARSGSPGGSAPRWSARSHPVSGSGSAGATIPASRWTAWSGRCAQPELLEWEWTIPGEAPSVLRVELSPADGTGSVLVLEHRALPPDQAAGLGAGWHGFLDALATGDGSGWDDRFAELVPAYRERVAALG